MKVTKSDVLPIKKHIINSLNLSVYGIKQKFENNVTYLGDLSTDLNEVYAIFRSEMQTKSVESFIEWLEGVPCVLDIYHNHCDIVEMGINCGLIRTDYKSKSARENAENKYINQWYSRVATCFFQLLKMDQHAYKTVITYCKENNK